MKARAVNRSRPVSPAGAKGGCILVGEGVVVGGWSPPSLCWSTSGDGRVGPQPSQPLGFYCVKFFFFKANKIFADQARRWCVFCCVGKTQARAQAGCPVQPDPQGVHRGCWTLLHGGWGSCLTCPHSHPLGCELGYAILKPFRKKALAGVPAPGKCRSLTSYR